MEIEGSAEVIRPQLQRLDEVLGREEVSGALDLGAATLVELGVGGEVPPLDGTELREVGQSGGHVEDAVHPVRSIALKKISCNCES